MNEEAITSTPSAVEVSNVQAGGYGTPNPQEASRTFSKTTFMIEGCRIVQTEFFETGLIVRDYFADEKIFGYSRHSYDASKEETVRDLYVVHTVNGKDFLIWFNGF